MIEIIRHNSARERGGREHPQAVAPGQSTSQTTGAGAWLKDQIADIRQTHRFGPKQIQEEIDPRGHHRVRRSGGQLRQVLDVLLCDNALHATSTAAGRTQHPHGRWHHTGVGRTVSWNCATMDRESTRRHNATFSTLFSRPQRRHRARPVYRPTVVPGQPYPSRIHLSQPRVAAAFG